MFAFFKAALMYPEWAVVLLKLDNCSMIQCLQHICRELPIVSVATLLMKLLTFTCSNLSFPLHYILCSIAGHILYPSLIKSRFDFCSLVFCQVFCPSSFAILYFSF